MPKEQLYLQITAMSVVLAIFSYQLIALQISLRRLENQNGNLMSLSNEKKSVLYQTLTFAFSFLIKMAFNVYIFLTAKSGETLEGSISEIAWSIMVIIWTGLPISFSFFKNYQSFRKPDQPEEQQNRDSRKKPL